MSNQNLELLSIIHSIQAASLDAQKLLNTALADDVTGTIPMNVVTLAAMSSLLAVQSKLINVLVEENQEIVDRIDEMATRLESS